MPQTLQSIQQQQQERQQQIVQHQEASQQLAQKPLQPQVGQIHHISNAQQQSVIPAMQVQQVASQFQQIEAIQKQASQMQRATQGIVQQQNPETTAPVSIALTAASGP